MKLIIRLSAFVGFLLIFFSTTIHAETLYVSDSLKLTVRTGKGSSYKIIAVIQSGDAVEILQPEDEWALVRLPDGKEGWVISRYLTGKITNNIKLSRLQRKHKTLTVQAAALLEENTELKRENQKTGSELAKTQKDAKELKDSYETLKTESAGYLKLKSKYEKTASQLVEKTKDAEKFEKELTKLELGRTIRWFLTGAGVLLLGFLMGFATKRQRRRTTLR